MSAHLTIGIEDLADLIHAAASPRLLAAGIDTHLRPSGDFWIRIAPRIRTVDTFDVSIECAHGGIPYGAGSATTIAKATDDAIAEAEIRIRDLRINRAKGGRHG